MHRPDCGKENENDSQFCLYCGQQINPVSIPIHDESNKIIQRQNPGSNQADKNGSKYSIRIVFLIFLCLFLVWAGASWYFTSQIKGSSDNRWCPAHYDYQWIINGDVVYHHDFCSDTFVIFAVLFPFMIIISENIGSLSISSALALGWVALGLWAVFFIWVGFSFIRKNTVETEYVAADLTDFIIALFKIGVKSVIAAVLFIIGTIWFEEILQVAMNGFAGMDSSPWFAASYLPRSITIPFLLFFFSIPAIICLIVIFFIFRSIRMKTVILVDDIQSTAKVTVIKLILIIIGAIMIFPSIMRISKFGTDFTYLILAFGGALFILGGLLMLILKTNLPE